MTDASGSKSTRLSRWLRWFGPPDTASAGDRRDRVVWGWIFLVAWTSKWMGAQWLLAPYDLQTSPWHFGYEAGHIAGNLAAGNGFSIAAGDGQFLPTAWISPAYPLLLSWIFRTWGAFSEAAAQVAVATNCLFQAGTAVLLYGLTRRVGGRQAGLFAVAIFLLNPGGWQFLAWAWPSQFLALAILAHIGLLLRASSGSLAIAALCGGSLGAALLIDGTAITLLPVTAIVIWNGARRTGARRALAASVASLVLVLAPWAIRNQHDLGMPNPLRGNLGVNLWVGNHPGARQESFHGMQQSPWHDRAEALRLVELGEAEYDRQSRERALAQLVSEPATFARNTALRFSGFWLAEWWSGYRHIDWRYSLGHVSLTLIACVGAWRARRYGIGFAVVALVLFTLPYALTVHGHGRYRVPVEPVLCWLAAFSWRPPGSSYATNMKMPGTERVRSTFSCWLFGSSVTNRHVSETIATHVV